MAFPTVSAADSQSGTVTSNSTTWALTYPTNLASGDLIVAFIARDGGGGAPTWPAGFVEYANGEGTCHLHVAKKSSAGTETGSFNVTSLPSEQGCWRVMRITGWEGTLGTDWTIGASGGAVQRTDTSGSGTTPDPFSLDPIWGTEDTLWIAASVNDGTPTVTGFPSGFTQQDHSTAGGHAQSSGGAGGAGFGIAFRKEASATQDPGTFTLSGSEGWYAITIGVRPAAAAAPRVPRLTNMPQLLAH